MVRQIRNYFSSFETESLFSETFPLMMDTWKHATGTKSEFEFFFCMMKWRKHANEHECGQLYSRFEIIFACLFSKCLCFFTTSLYEYACFFGFHSSEAQYVHNYMFH